MTILDDPFPARIQGVLGPQARAVREQAGEVLRRRGIDPVALSVEVRPREDRLRCVVRVDVVVDPLAAQMMAVRVVEVLRSLDQEVDGIDVDVVDAEGKLRRVTP